ncbi:hypothetical protein B0H66DRAFT_602444 [Apodospora peruviana]|uniref:Uncharacterized protein n=1 Tax=Apodospora peruviana TaxID=516989 RepID=A0AAE0M9L9_9PEZI|nr:hypothetical protein B0H66DRAFT_602444 [Apodospora peruviana]
MAVTSAVSDLVKSFVELFSSLINGVYTIVHSFFAGIFHLFSGFIAFVGDIFQGVIDVLGGVGKFVAGNIVMLGLIGAAGYAYVRYTAQGQIQGQKAKETINAAAANAKKST